ncbi:diguanylate cyclase [Cupriavidus sp. UYMU48A]|nr:diguanylate cyclase [Cupriavidus sp. UYMU48A]
MKLVDSTLGGPLAAFDAPFLPRKGWSVFIDALAVPVRIGIHPHEHDAPQPIVIDARLGYRCEPREEGEWIDYEGYCARVAAFLAHRPHTRLLETLVADIAELSFREWPALDTLTLAVHKPKIRPGTQRVGVALEWTRADYLRRSGKVS